MAGRVCMVVHEHFPRDFRVRREARALVQAGYDVTVLSLHQRGQGHIERFQGMQVLRLPIRRHRGSPLPVYLLEYLAFAGLSSGLLAGLQPLIGFDAIHVHTPPDFLIGAGLLPRLSGTKLVLDVHDLTPELYASRFKGRGGALARKLCEATEQVACKTADRVITTTQAFKDLLVARGAPEERVLVLHNCPDPEIFKSATRQKRSGDGFVIMHHGTLLHRYGQDLLIDAFDRIHLEIPHARLEIYGEGDFKPRLVKLVRERRIEDRVTFHGEVSQEEIACALTKADLCVIPNRTDPIMELAFPTKLLESLHVGCPVVASSTRLVAKTFESGGIHLVPPGDLDALSAAILGFARNPEALGKLAEEGSRQAVRFDWNQEKRKLTELYRRLLSP